MIGLGILVLPPALFIASAVAVGVHYLAGRKGRTAAHLVFRLATGDHMDGAARTNRTAFTPGTRLLNRQHADMPMSWLARQPRAKRAAAYWATVYVLPLAGYGLVVAATLTVTTGLAALAAATAYGLLAAARWVARHKHRTHVVKPLGAALAAKFGWHKTAVAATLKVHPRLADVQAGDRVFRARVPAHFAAQPTEQKWVEDLVSRRVYPTPVKYRWHYSRGVVEGFCAAAAPREVTAAAHLDLIDHQLGWSQYFLGTAAENAHQIWDATGEDPHGMMSGRSRDGKTNTNLAVAGQGLRRGEHVTAIDPKRVSLRCLAGVPGFTLANDPGDPLTMWAAIRAFREEMDAAIAGDRTRPPGVLILEEMNQLADLFRTTWLARKNKSQTLADMPPALDLAAILHQGAQFGYHVWAAGQDLRHAVMFGYRQAFGTALIAGHTDTSWNYTTGGAKPIPPPPGRRGRFYFARPGQPPTLTQIVCADPRGGRHNEQAWRQFALNGRTPGGGTEPPPGKWTAWTEHTRPSMPTLALPHARHPELPTWGLLGPKQAAQYLGMTQHAFNMARRQHGPIPGEQQTRTRYGPTNRWPREALDHWYAHRNDHHENRETTTNA